MINKKIIISEYQAIRSLTEQLCAKLAIEDYVIQSIEDVSPPKWHLGHTTWFFETFILKEYCPSYNEFDPAFKNLFNSYYQELGSPYPRHKRGIQARPTVATVYQYRHNINEHLINFIDSLDEEKLASIIPVLELGMHHEQQHQELLLMDIKHNYFMDIQTPTYLPDEKPIMNTKPLEWLNFSGGKITIGYNGNDFCYDNELSHHETILWPYQLSSRLVTNGEYIEFITAGGYENPTWWLAEGWEQVQKNQWQAPLYWQKIANKWHIFTLNGYKEVDVNEPVCHVSYYEADAYARWANLRLPTEAEWEHAVSHIKNVDGNFLETKSFHPHPASHDQTQFFGDVWEWTTSPYIAYPGYQPIEGKLKEYNSKFMSNQIVLRGGSCITPKSHIRPTYRNFYQPDKRWQFSGIRLARNVERE